MIFCFFFFLTTKVAFMSYLFFVVLFFCCFPFLDQSTQHEMMRGVTPHSVLFGLHFLGGFLWFFAIIIKAELMTMVLSGKCQFGRLYWLMNCLAGEVRGVAKDLCTPTWLKGYHMARVVWSKDSCTGTTNSLADFTGS